MPEVLIVGGGLEGCATAWQLAARGVKDTMVLERATIGSGGTGKSSGVVRCHYGVSSLAAMANFGLDTFERAKEIFGVDIGFRQTGYVVGVGDENAEALRASLADQRAVGVQTEEVDRAFVAGLWPAAHLDDFAAFGWEVRGGYGDAYRTAHAFANAAKLSGAQFRQNSRVVELLTSGERVTGVRLATGQQIHAGTVVIAAGPWSVELLAPLGMVLPIVTHREQIVVVDPRQDIGSPPVFSDLVSLQYVKPEVSGVILFGNSDLAKLEPADPDSYANQASGEFLEIAVRKLTHRFPSLHGASVSSTYAGCYDVTPDFNPVISRTPYSSLVVAAGFSGHGFKISPAVGRLVADLVIDGDSNDSNVVASDFRFTRFDEGDLLRSLHPYIGAGEMR